MKKLYLKSTTVIIISLIIILFACKKTKVDNITAPPLPQNSVVTASVAGRVTDLNNASVSGVSVAAGASTTTIDANGQFTLKDIQLDKDAGFVKVTKAGYFSGSRTFLVNANTTNYIKIQMIPKAVSGTIASSSGGNVDVTGGAKINFTASSFVNAGGNTAYAGDVSVAGYYLNPAAANFRDYMPGDLRGISTANKEIILKSFGMLAVEMYDAGGQKLQLAIGKTATITIPIPSVMQAAAPATISLWYFDETKGLWKVEGTATKQTTNYVGTVSHFSFWNAGEPGAEVRLDATFKNDVSGLPFTNKLVTITSVIFGTTKGYTDNNGKISGLVPANEKLEIKVFDDCSQLNYTTGSGPLSTNTDLGIISISFSSCYLTTVTVKGTVVNCNNAAVTNGYVKIKKYNLSVPINNGSFIISYDIPSNSADTSTPTLTAYDLGSGDSSKPVPIIISGSGSIDIGKVGACKIVPVADFTYTVSGSFVPVTVTFTNTSTTANSWVWDFDDGTSSSAQNPTHIYSSPGNRTVKLTVTGPGGTNTITKNFYFAFGASDTYINLTLNGVSYSWTPPNYEFNGYRSDSGSPTQYTYIRTDTAGGLTTPRFRIHISINHDNALPGNIPPGNYPFVLTTQLDGVVYDTYNNNSVTNVTQYESAGGYITGSATGWVKKYIYPTHSTDSLPFTCTYRVLRLY